MIAFNINQKRKRPGIYSLLLYSLLITAFSLKAFSQEIVPFQRLTFKGRVTDEHGRVLHGGVNIHIPGTMRGTISDMNGDFIVEAKAKETIEVSYAGKFTQSIQLQEKDTAGLHIILKTKPQRLKDITIHQRQEVNFIPGEECFGVVEKDASFPGGEDSLKVYVQKAVSYPVEALKHGEEGQVIVRFTVGKDGAISAPAVVKSVSPALDREAIRVITGMPDWHPAMQRNKPVITQQELPVNFVINLSGSNDGSF